MHHTSSRSPDSIPPFALCLCSFPLSPPLPPLPPSLPLSLSILFEGWAMEVTTWTLGCQKHHPTCTLVSEAALQNIHLPNSSMSFHRPEAPKASVLVESDVYTNTRNARNAARHYHISSKPKPPMQSTNSIARRPHHHLTFSSLS